MDSQPEFRRAVLNHSAPRGRFSAPHGPLAPARMPGYALIRRALSNCEICIPLTTGTSRDPYSAFASPSEWDVLMPIVSLRGPVRCRMAVHASRACNHSGHFAKNSARTQHWILNCIECSWIT
jgi:hypothetical protein